jgi:hypothetical protein
MVIHIKNRVVPHAGHDVLLEEQPCRARPGVGQVGQLLLDPARKAKVD